MDLESRCFGSTSIASRSLSMSPLTQYAAPHCNGIKPFGEIRVDSTRRI